ncbi:hypothetical protein L249_5098 [Ophiocordyceps polyrhachis-furcata BCC 54312]|uniref:Uncharacterized protein n=1 Tax=Ophiocordyceps polyrhachis-furcata BCC 54312 TaxID=1330021 RepID=A0A367L3N8_9HYPO|nr:hypothetical protein L249_5098 [Ophiocordyceps polyrhachis-furcata BCC 54312]
MLTRRLIDPYIQKIRLPRQTSVPRLPDLPYVPSLVRPVRPVQPRAVAVAASYVVVPFLPLLCDVRRPRAGYGRPGVTVSGAPAKVGL